MAYKAPGGMTQAEIKAEIERKSRAGESLAGNKKGYVAPQNLSYWQQLESAKQSANNQGTASTGGGGVGVSSPSAGGWSGGGGSDQPSIVYVPAPSAPGSDFVPGVTKDAITGYGFTGIVGIGAAFIVMSLMFSFRRVRGR